MLQYKFLFWTDITSEKCKTNITDICIKFGETDNDNVTITECVWNAGVIVLI